MTAVWSEVRVIYAATDDPEVLAAWRAYGSAGVPPAVRDAVRRVTQELREVVTPGVMADPYAQVTLSPGHVAVGVTVRAAPAVAFDHGLAAVRAAVLRARVLRGAPITSVSADVTSAPATLDVAETGDVEAGLAEVGGREG